MDSESTRAANDDKRDLSDFLDRCDGQECKNEVKRGDSDDGYERLNRFRSFLRGELVCHFH
jgi:hypothetical protein